MSLTPLSLPFSRTVVDRSAHLRADEAGLEELWKQAFIIHFASGKFRIKTMATGVATEADGTPQINRMAHSLDLLNHEGVEALSHSETFSIGNRYFLGMDGEQPYFAWVCDGDDVDEFHQYMSLRDIGDDLNALQVGLAVHTQALANWHAKHPRCSLCGSTTVPALGGSVRRCTVDETEHYPRNDPAIIVLIKDRKDRILLGRQQVWPEHRFSTFAGFVEPGESFEHCVIREVREEAGIGVSEIHYLGSQPWPFPASLMIAFEAVTDDPLSARPDGEEIVEIIWLTRDELRNAVHKKEILLPPSISVARQMIEAWYGPNAKRDLSGGQAWRN